MNLSKGKLGELGASLIGLIIVGKILVASFGRDPSQDPPPFYLYLDEFQNVATDSIKTILSEARKYKLGLTLAHQYIKQIPPDIKDAIFGNVGSKTIFRIEAEDAKFMENYFAPTFTQKDIIGQSVGNSYMQILSNNTPQKPFNIYTPLLPKGNQEIAEVIKELSALKYGVPREEVENLIMKKNGNLIISDLVFFYTHIFVTNLHVGCYTYCMQDLKNLTLLQKAGVFTLLCVGVLALSGVWFLFTATDEQNTRTFNVQGTGEVDVKPTKATINADFVGEGKTPEEAINSLNTLSTKVFAELETAGVAKDKIKTNNVSTNPKYDYCYNYPTASRPGYCLTNPNDPKIVGYEAMQNFSVSIDNDQALVSKLLGLMPTLGARNTNGPNWEVDNDEAIAEAREMAVKEAKEKAESIAKSLGMRLGDVRYYNENQGGGYPTPMYDTRVMNQGKEMMSVGAAAPSIPVSEGTEKVTVNVDITYELE